MLKFDQLTTSYDGKLVLNRLSFTLTPHQLTVIVGKNGCGKSTLVSCINQEQPYTGEITCFDRNLALLPARERAQQVAILPQVLTSPHITVEELVGFGRNPYLDFGRRPSKADRKAVEDAIEAIGISPLRNRMVDHLSGGERQKAYLAMILAQKARVVVLDEPTTYMDAAYESAFFQQMNAWKHQHKMTLLVVMHNLSQALKYADRLIVLDHHTIQFEGSSQACFDSGVLESVFQVQRHVFQENGEKFYFFT